MLYIISLLNNSIPDPLLFRWHANYGVEKTTKLIDYTSDFGRRNTYNIYLAAPGWCQMYGSGIDIKYLVANYDANPDNFAVNYNKTSRTLQFDKPSDSGVTLGTATISGLNFSSSEDIRATSFGYPSKTFI